MFAEHFFNCCVAMRGCQLLATVTSAGGGEAVTGFCIPVPLPSRLAGWDAAAAAHL